MFRLGRVLVVACGLAAPCALLACDAIFGIDVFPPGSDDGSSDSSVTSEGGGDARGDGSTDDRTPSDVTTSDGHGEGGPFDAAPPRDVAADTSDEAPVQCAPQLCTGGQTRCVNGLLQTCEKVGPCFQWGTPAACPDGGACWGAGTDAYCCTGGTDQCAPSCQGQILDAGTRAGCGATGDQSCCTSLMVDGGTFLRSYDGVTNADMTNPATVSTFALDKYEVTVGRFRNFVTAWVNGFRPTAGTGVHTHLNSGMGLTDSSSPGSYERGWNGMWTAPNLDQKAYWDSWLTCDGANSTWTSSPGPNESLPINCVDWASAYAFCIWDGGFLPSEAEWNYAAAGGGDAQGQRVYAWSSPSTSETIDCTYASYAACVSQVAIAGLDPKGNGRWGQADLTGNLWEWNLDAYASYANPCNDCAYLTDTGQRSIRGASYNYPANQLFVATRVGDDPTVRYSDNGFRCARAP
ncbi:MAG TPA: SUMF1/EgtB/PvdO family nonheme iron enzyme [Polyangiaceae bacterium]